MNSADWIERHRRSIPLATLALLSVEAAFAQKLPDLPQGTSYDVIQMSPNIIMPFVSYALISDGIPQSALKRLAQYQEDREAAVSAGFDEHLVKPADIETLRQLLAEGPKKR